MSETNVDSNLDHEDVLLIEEDSNEIEDSEVEKFLTFAIGTEVYGVHLESVQEIIREQRVTYVPDVAGHIRGVINLRGTVVPLVDVRVCFGMETQPMHERTCFVVVQVRDINVGLLVDQIAEVVSVHPSQIETPRQDRVHGHSAAMTSGLVRVDGAVKVLIDIENLLFSEDEPNSELVDKSEQSRTVRDASV